MIASKICSRCHGNMDMSYQYCTTCGQPFKPLTSKQRTKKVLRVPPIGPYLTSSSQRCKPAKRPPPARPAASGQSPYDAQIASLIARSPTYRAQQQADLHRSCVLEQHNSLGFGDLDQHLRSRSAPLVVNQHVQRLPDISQLYRTLHGNEVVYHSYTDQQRFLHFPVQIVPGVAGLPDAGPLSQQPVDEERRQRAVPRAWLWQSTTVGEDEEANEEVEGAKDPHVHEQQLAEQQAAEAHLIQAIQQTKYHRTISPTVPIDEQLSPNSRRQIAMDFTAIEDAAFSSELTGFLTHLEDTRYDLESARARRLAEMEGLESRSFCLPEDVLVLDDEDNSGASTGPGAASVAATGTGPAAGDHTAAAQSAGDALSDLPYVEDYEHSFCAPKVLSIIDTSTEPVLSAEEQQILEAIEQAELAIITDVQTMQTLHALVLPNSTSAADSGSSVESADGIGLEASPTANQHALLSSEQNDMHFEAKLTDYLHHLAESRQSLESARSRRLQEIEACLRGGGSSATTHTSNSPRSQNSFLGWNLEDDGSAISRGMSYLSLSCQLQHLDDAHAVLEAARHVEAEETLWISPFSLLLDGALDETLEDASDSILPVYRHESHEQLAHTVQVDHLTSDAQQIHTLTSQLVHSSTNRDDKVRRRHRQLLVGLDEKENEDDDEDWMFALLERDDRANRNNIPRHLEINQQWHSVSPNKAYGNTDNPKITDDKYRLADTSVLTTAADGALVPHTFSTHQQQQADQNVMVSNVFIASYQQMKQCLRTLQQIDLRIPAAELNKSTSQLFHRALIDAELAHGQADAVDQQITSTVQLFFDKARSQRTAIAREIADSLKKSVTLEKFFSQQLATAIADEQSLTHSGSKRRESDEGKDIRQQADQAMRACGQEVDRLQQQENALIAKLRYGLVTVAAC